MRSVTPSGRKSRRRDSHPHDPVYRTGAFLCRATSAIRRATVRGFEPRATVLEAVCSPRSTPLCKAADLQLEAGSSRHSFSTGRMPCLILQFNVPVAFADETRPAFNPNTACRVQRPPRRANPTIAIGTTARRSARARSSSTERWTTRATWRP